MKYEALPAWLLTCCVRRWLPESHPWRQRRFTLHEWYAGRTRLCTLLDMSMWSSVSLLLGVIAGTLWR